MFNFIRNWQTIFQISCTISQSHHQDMRASVSWIFNSWYDRLRCIVFGLSYSNQCVSISLRSHLHFPDDFQYQASLCVLFFHLWSKFGEVSVQIFCPLFKLGFWFLIIEFWEFFICSRYKSFNSYVFCKDFLNRYLFEYSFPFSLHVEYHSHIHHWPNRNIQHTKNTLISIFWRKETEAQLL